jgi:hypothetical protein
MGEIIGTELLLKKPAGNQLTEKRPDNARATRDRRNMGSRDKGMAASRAEALVEKSKDSYFNCMFR